MDDFVRKDLRESYEYALMLIKQHVSKKLGIEDPDAMKEFTAKFTSRDPAYVSRIVREEGLGMTLAQEPEMTKNSVGKIVDHIHDIDISKEIIQKGDLSVGDVKEDVCIPRDASRARYCVSGTSVYPCRIVGYGYDEGDVYIEYSSANIIAEVSFRDIYDKLIDAQKKAVENCNREIGRLTCLRDVYEKEIENNVINGGD